MTREELLEAAQKFYAIHKDCIINDIPVKEYLEIGLKALVQEPILIDTGYDTGFLDGYLQACYDHVPEENKEKFTMGADLIKNVFNMANKQKEYMEENKDAKKQNRSDSRLGVK